jgi:hypothetical protein
MDADNQLLSIRAESSGKTIVIRSNKLNSKDITDDLLTIEWRADLVVKLQYDSLL